MLSLSLQATCPPQPSSLDSVLLCHLCPSFHCPRRQAWCPLGLALAWLPTTDRPGMREGGLSGKEMGRGGSNTGLPKQVIAPSSSLPLLLICGPCLALPCCSSYSSPDSRGWRSHGCPLLTVALKGLHLAVIKTF